MQNLLLDLQIVRCDFELALRAAQLNIVARRLRQGRCERAAPLFLRQIDLRIGGLDLATDLAPDVELPGRVEARGVIIDRRNSDGVAAGQRREQADDAVLAIELALILAGPVEGRQLGRGGDAALEATLRDAYGCGFNVEIGGGDALLEIGEDRIVERLPPRRVDRLRDRRTQARFLRRGRRRRIGERALRQAGFRRGEIRPERAGRQGKGPDQSGRDPQVRHNAVS